MELERLAHGFRLGDVEVEPERGLMILPGGEQRRLARQPMEVLLRLAAHEGRVVPKGELLDAVWGPTAGSDEGLKRNLHELRRALNDDARAPRYLETIPRRGYRCVAEVAPRAPVRSAAADAASSPAEVPATTPPGTAEGSKDGDPTPSSSRPSSWPTDRWAPPDTESITVTWTGPLVTGAISPTQPASADGRRAAAGTADQAVAAGSRRYLTLAGALLIVLLVTALVSGPRWWPAPPTDGTAPLTTLVAVKASSPVSQEPADRAAAAAAARLADGVFDALARMPGLTPTRDDVSAGAGGRRVFVLEYSVADPSRAEFRLFRQDGDFPRVVFSEAANLALPVSGEGARIALQVARNVIDDLDFDVLRTAATSHRTTANDEAYLAYLRGRTACNKRGEADLREAIEHFSRALALDPQYARAYSNMAAAWVLIALYDYGDREHALEQAQAFATEAMALNDQLGEALAVLGMFHSLKWQWAAAERRYLQAIERDPTEPLGHHWYGTFLAETGQLSASLRLSEALSRQDPRSQAIRNRLAWAYLALGEHEEARTHLDIAQHGELRRDYWSAWAQFAIDLADPLTSADAGERFAAALARLDRPNAWVAPLHEAVTSPSTPAVRAAERALLDAHDMETVNGRLQLLFNSVLLPDPSLAARVIERMAQTARGHTSVALWMEQSQALRTDAGLFDHVTGLMGLRAWWAEAGCVYDGREVLCPAR